MSLKRISFFVLFCILAMALLGGCAPAKGAEYKIGFVSSATGNYASLGLPEAKTAEMIQKQLDAQGGITGPDGVKHPVKIIIYDDANEADKAVSSVTRLITEDEVIAVVSSTGSGTSVAQIPVCEENKTPCVSMASAKSITTDPKTSTEYKWMFKTPQTNGHAGEWQAAYLKAKGLTNICIIYTNDGYGKDCLATYKAAAEAAGLSVIYEGSYAATDTEFSAQMASVQASGCQAVEIGSTPPVASLATIAVRNALPETPITLGHGVCNQSYITTAGKAAEGVVFPCGKVTVIDQLADTDPQKAVLQKYITDYTASTNGEAISTFGGHAWDALEMIINAMSTLKNGMSLTDQRAAVRDYLENKVVGWPGISGTFTMSPTDHNGLAKDSLLFVTVKDGKWVAFPEKDW
jgi:branched-chain amino acid transport system substrate-binding protein